MDYIIYNDPIQSEISEIVDYLNSLDYPKIIPQHFVEQEFPPWVTELPTIFTARGDRYFGLDQCVQYYEMTYGIKNLLQKIHQ